MPKPKKPGKIREDDAFMLIAVSLKGEEVRDVFVIDAKEYEKLEKSTLKADKRAEGKKAHDPKILPEGKIMKRDIPIALRVTNPCVYFYQAGYGWRGYCY